jgi:hypothetical protein
VQPDGRHKTFKKCIQSSPSRSNKIIGDEESNYIKILKIFGQDALQLFFVNVISCQVKSVKTIVADLIKIWLLLMSTIWFY